MRQPRWYGPVVLLAAAVALSACTSSGQPSTSVATAASGPTSSSSPTSSGQQHTLVAADGLSPAEHAALEADRVLARVPVPPGATRLTTSPAEPKHPAEQPGVSSLVVTTSYFRLAGTAAAAQAWIRAHPPESAELRTTGTSGGGDAHYLISTFEFPSTGADLGTELLALSAGPDGSGHVVLRVDAEVVWLDPTPYRDDAVGPRLHVAVAEGCPRDDRGIVGVANEGADLDTALLPIGEPVSALVCAYSGANGSTANKETFSLVGEARLTPAEARALALEVSSVRLAHTVGAIRSCPAMDGTANLVAFSYPGRDVDLWWPLGGCATVSNGHIQAEASAPPAVRLTRR
jgi:hypothetical protein